MNQTNMAQAALMRAAQSHSAPSTATHSFTPIPTLTHTLGGDDEIKTLLFVRPRRATSTESETLASIFIRNVKYELRASAHNSTDLTRE